MSDSAFHTCFKRVTGFDPLHWQLALGEDGYCCDRLIRVPTGFGKTAGVVLPWLFHRVLRNDPSWPRRLVFTLPMRVLVEQTEQAVSRWIAAAGADASVHVLMGGSDAGPWHLAVEKPTILIGTQDMILSRALNRGYGAARGRWPIDFGLLHHDALWVLDEVQLMDVGLVTSVQLSQFRREHTQSALRPSFAWWMSATLQPRWLRTVDAATHVETLEHDVVAIDASQRIGGSWEVRKVASVRSEMSTPAEVASLVIDCHEKGTLTLVIVNRVARALDIYNAIETKMHGGKKSTPGELPDVELVHSRFRGAEREQWARFLSRDADLPARGRIVVATQVVEAGVDVSAQTLITDLAPWPSLVQRFGRCARYAGEAGRVIVIGAPPASDQEAAPYEAEPTRAALELLLAHGVTDVGPRAIEALEEKLDSDTLAALYPYEPIHVIRGADVHELFDTSPDLSGADIDVSRYIRSGEERDVSIFWRSIDVDAHGRAPGELLARGVAPPSSRELCRAPVSEARAWLRGRTAYIRDYRAGAWLRLANDDLSRRVHAGATVMVAAEEGGYETIRGWSPRSTSTVPLVVQLELETPDERTAGGEDDDALSELEWQTIAEHGRDVGVVVREIGVAIGLPERLVRLLDLAGRWHDVGKAHPVFQNAIHDGARRERSGIALQRDLAKAPEHAWRKPAYSDRPGFRHELASTIALLELLRRADSMHSALLGPHRELLAALGQEPIPVEDPTSRENPLAHELCALSAAELDLVAYLVCAHHGKVRCGWTSTAKDQERGEGAIHGVREGDELPSTPVSTASGVHTMPALRLSLEAAELGVGPTFGASWTERVTGLLREHGPFTLAFLEAVLRAADVRASMALASAGKST